MRWPRFIRWLTVDRSADPAGGPRGLNSLPTIQPLASEDGRPVSMAQAATPCNQLPPMQRAACRRQHTTVLQRRWLETLTWGPDVETARWIQFWLGVFPVSWRQLPDPRLLERQTSSIRRHLAGTYGELLTAMVLDPAVQISLNGPANHRRSPNENLARELLELFSLGEGHYGEADVRQAARALTGYRLDASQRLVLDPRRHSPGAKTILGRTAPFDAASLAVWLAEQPATARFIAGRAWRHTIGSPPPAARLDGLAQGWRRQGLSLPWLRRSLAEAPEAVASRRQGLKLADPLDMLARSLKLLGSRHPEALAISLRGLPAMGQAPFDPPSVKGWPVNEQWLQVRWLQARRRTLQALLANEEVWDSRSLPAELPASLTALPPLGLALPARATRENLALLFADPVWQLA